MEGAVTPRSPRGRTHGHRAGLAVAVAVLLAIAAPHLADPALHDFVTLITGAIAVLVSGLVVIVAFMAILIAGLGAALDAGDAQA